MYVVKWRTGGQRSGIASAIYKVFLEMRSETVNGRGTNWTLLASSPEDLYTSHKNVLHDVFVTYTVICSLLCQSERLLP